MKTNTTGRERWDLQIQQIYNTQRTIPNKKRYSRKQKNKTHYGKELLS